MKILQLQSAVLATACSAQFLYILQEQRKKAEAVQLETEWKTKMVDLERAKQQMEAESRAAAAGLTRIGRNAVCSCSLQSNLYFAVITHKLKLV